MRRLLATQRYTNASISVLAVEAEPHLHKHDTLFLRFRVRGHPIVGVFMRPDEAVATVATLARAVHKHVIGYRWKAVRRRKRKR